MQDYNIHIIQPEDSLESIATLYQLDKNDIKFFHNNRCITRDQILIGITHQKELFLPRTAVVDKNKLVNFSTGNSIEFNPEKLDQKYGVSINIALGEKSNELKYEAHVKWLNFENNYHFFEIDRVSKIFINDEETNNIADLLAYKVSKVLYPLQVSVDKKGKFNQVENLEVFKKRWSDITAEIYKEFEGEIVDLYLQKMQQMIESPEMISYFMKNDYFLRTLFFGIYQKFGSNYRIQGQESFPIVKNSIEPNYEIKLEIDPLKDDYDLIQIEGKGNLNDERTNYDFINEAPFSFIIDENSKINTNGNFRVVTHLNGRTALPESLYLECDIMLQEKKKISVVIATTE